MSQQYSVALRNLMKGNTFVGTNMPTAKVYLLDKIGGTTNVVPHVDSISISREEASFGQIASFNIVNINPADIQDMGYFNPHRNDTTNGKASNQWYKEIVPSKKVQIKMGYGANLVSIFVGIIDTVNISYTSGECMLKVTCRDMTRLLLDRTITSYDIQPLVSDAINHVGGYSSLDTTIEVDDGTKFSQYNVLNVPSTGEDMLILNIVGNSITVIRGWKGTTAGTIADNAVLNCIYTFQYLLEYPVPQNTLDIFLDYNSTNPDIADVFKDLCLRAGFVTGDILIENTGILLNNTPEGSLEFDTISYADAIEQLSTMTAWSSWCDENGKINFKNPQNNSYYKQDEEQMFIANTPIYLTKCFTHSTDKTLMESEPIEGTIKVYNYTKTTLYELDTDYTYNPSTYTIMLKETGNIVEYDICKIDYNYTNGIFENGLNLYSFDLNLSHSNYYRSIMVTGDTDTYIAAVNTPNWDSSVIEADKTLFVNDTTLDDIDKVANCANRLLLDMKERYMTISLEGIANPWLQIGDTIRILIYGTIYGIYKISGYTMSYSATEGMTMNLNGYFISNLSV